VADEVTRPRPEGEEEVQDIQVMISSAAHPTGLRSLKVRTSSFSLHSLDVYLGNR